MAKIHKRRSSKSRKQRQASPYSTFARNQSSPDTIRCYEYQLRRFEKFIVDRDASKIEDVTTADLLAYRETLEARGLKPSTVKRYLAAIRSLFQWAIETGVIDHDPAAGLRLPRVLRNRTPDYLTSEETTALINSLEKNVDNLKDESRHLLGEEMNFVEGLEAVFSEVPYGVSLSSASISVDSIHVNGAAETRTSAIHYVGLIEQGGDFAAVNVTSLTTIIVKDSDPLMQFTIIVDR